MKKLLPTLFFFFSVMLPSSAHSLCLPTGEIGDETTSEGFVTRLTKKPLYISEEGGYLAEPLLINGQKIFVAPSFQNTSNLVELNDRGMVHEWKINGSINGSLMQISNKLIGAFTTEGQFVVVSSETGKVEFEKTFDGGFDGSGAFTQIIDSNGSTKNVVLAACADGQLLTIDLLNGAVISKVFLGRMASGTPLLWNDFCAVGSLNGHFYLRNKQKNKTSDIFVGGGRLTDFARIGDRILFGNSDGKIFAVSPTGAETISYDLEKTENGTPCIDIAPLVVDDVILIADTFGRLHFRGQNLEEIRKPFHLEVSVTASMKLSPDGKFVVIPCAGALLYYNRSNGKITKISGFGTIAAPVTFGTDGKVYIADRTGAINVIKINPEKAP